MDYYATCPIPKQCESNGKHPDRLSDKDFRLAVWENERGRDRATGQILYKSHPNVHRRGQVCHLKGRRVRPDWKTDPNRAVLLSDFHHQLSDHRGGNLLKLTEPETGEPATDARLPIRCTLYRRDGSVVWSHVR